MLPLLFHHILERRVWYATGARMGPHQTLHFVGEKLGSIQDGPQQCSRPSNTASGGGSSSSGSGGDIFGQPSPVTSDAACSGARRNKVYTNIMRQWEKAASSMVPMPRSSHRRVLGGQALPTRQVTQTI